MHWMWRMMKRVRYFIITENRTSAEEINICYKFVTESSHGIHINTCHGNYVYIKCVMWRLLKFIAVLSLNILQRHHHDNRTTWRLIDHVGVCRQKWCQFVWVFCTGHFVFIKCKILLYLPIPVIVNIASFHWSTWYNVSSCYIT